MFDIVRLPLQRKPIRGVTIEINVNAVVFTDGDCVVGAVFVHCLHITHAASTTADTTERDLVGLSGHVPR
ncbi:unnamed protein product [Hydatigera taeniaeformis]|uniref:Uncharacterized protein n=1 Tax=Hydatigena taeniaeformis TaxID=6205 RepID=A0A0R3X9A7_HYDTA|nr:unnamed protein product [Hydatigera taeniaeformis]